MVPQSPASGLRTALPKQPGTAPPPTLETVIGSKVMACVSRELVNNHPQTKKGLGGSGNQTRIATPFLEICGIAFPSSSHQIG